MEKDQKEFDTQVSSQRLNRLTTDEKQIKLYMPKEAANPDQSILIKIQDIKSELNDLDLNLDLRIRVGENLPWYAAILGGLPAVAGSAVINEIFEEDINNLTNYQYEVLGTIKDPKLERVKQEIK